MRIMQNSEETGSENGGERFICVRCGHANDARASRCRQCQAPLDDFAATSPWEMGTAKNSAYSSLVSPKTKPIIFWGAWLYFGPSAVGAVYFCAVFLRDFLTRKEFGKVYDEGTGGHVLLFLFTALYGLLSIWALWSVTKGYLGKKK